MPDILPILVMQNKTSESPDKTKVAIKSGNITPFSGIFHIMPHFHDKYVSSEIWSDGIQKNVCFVLALFFASSLLQVVCVILTDIVFI